LLAAPEPAVSPPAAPRLPGVVLALAGGPEGVAVDRSGTVAVNVRQPDGLVIFNLADPGSRRTVAMPGSARHLALAGPDGPLLVPDESDDRLVLVALPSGRVLASVPVGRQPHDAAAVGPGTVFVGDELANTLHVIRDGVVAAVVPAPLQPGGLAAAADGSVVIAVGVRGRRVTAYRSDGSLIGSATCGVGPTHAVTGNDRLFWVVDTDGGTVLGFTVDAHGPRQVARISVGPKPYGVAYDRQRSTLWVTLTGTNQLVGLHLSGTSVRSRTTYATVQQPNSVAVDEATGDVVVTGSTTRGALQVIGGASGA
jgi:DNA-binding beta-propeller fold protein YncE